MLRKLASVRNRLSNVFLSGKSSRNLSIGALLKVIKAQEKMDTKRTKISLKEWIESMETFDKETRQKKKGEL